MGKMGMMHAGILNSLNDVKVVSVAETEKFVLSFIKKNCPQIQVFSNYKDMLQDLDLVYITTPVNSHVEIASNCVKKKIPFFVEKPLSRNVSECIPLLKLLQDNQVVNMVGFVLRYADTFRKAKELLDRNEIGEIKEIKSSVFHTTQSGKGWRFNKEVSGGGVLIDLGIHLIDLLLWYFGKIKTVERISESQNFQNVEDSIKAAFRFENNVECSFEASWSTKGYRLPETTIGIEGTKGNMKVTQDFMKINYFEPSTDSKNEKIFYKQTLYTGTEVDIGGPEFTREDIDFVKSIKSRKQSELNVINSSKVQSVIDHIYRSSKTKNVEIVDYYD